MTYRIVVPNVYMIRFGLMVNAFLINRDEITLIDSGLLGSEDKILETVRKIGRKLSDITRILVTHCHSDHSGGLAVLKKETGAAVYMHPLDAALIRRGETYRPVVPAPGLFARLIYHFLIADQPKRVRVEPVVVENSLKDGDVLDDIDGMQAIHVPGHCAGQLAFLWPEQGGVLFVADAASNLFRLGFTPIYEDFEEGKRSLTKLASLDFEVACFGHGKPIKQGADRRFRDKFV